MEFGRLTLSEIDSVNFTLPAEPARNGTVLPGKPANGKVYVGMTKWGRTEWVGKIYPDKTKEKDFLYHYVKYFNSVELNATHYKIYNKEKITEWAKKAGKKDFKFCPKMYKGVTHFGSLSNKQSVLLSFLEGIEAFKEHLGPVIIQLSDQFSGKRIKELYSFLETLPSNMQLFLELRHPDLVSNTGLVDYLQSKNIGVVITDTAGRRDCAHMNLTVPKALIRIIYNNLHPTDFTRTDEWAERMKYWLDKGIEEIYFNIHFNEEEKSLDIAKYVVDKFNKECNQNIPAIKFI